MLLLGPFAETRPKYAPRGKRGLNVPSVLVEAPPSPLVTPTPSVSIGWRGRREPRATASAARVHAEIGRAATSPSWYAVSSSASNAADRARARAPTVCRHSLPV